jgi:hypothetical protein
MQLRRRRLQYTIESRELTSEYTHRLPTGGEPRRTTIEATDPGEAINRFVDLDECELVSFTNPRHGQESIATVKKNDSVYLVRVYT